MRNVFNTTSLQFLECNVIGLKSIHGKKFVEATVNGLVRADATTWTTAATITVEFDSTDPSSFVYLKSKYGKYLSAHPDGKLTWQVSWKRSWEKFKMKRVGRLIGFEGCHGNWISAHPGGSVSADGPKYNTWEYFEVYPDYC